MPETTMGKPVPPAKKEGADRWRKRVLDIVESRETHGSVQTLPVDLIDRYEDQPRKDFPDSYIEFLATSMGAQGQKTAIVVTVHPENPARYMLVDGECRWRAHLHPILQRKVIQAIVRPQMTYEERYTHAILANFARSGHDAYELILAVKNMREKGFTATKIGEVFAKSAGWVINYYNLATKVDDRTLRLMAQAIPYKNRLRFNTAILITSLPTEVQFETALAVTKGGMSIRAARHYIETVAAKYGIKIGGISSEPNRRRASLKSLIVSVNESFPSFLANPNMDSDEFFKSFGRNGLENLSQLTEKAKIGLEDLMVKIATALQAIKKAEELPPPPARHKGRKGRKKHHKG